MFASNDFTQPSVMFLIRLYSVFETEDSFSGFGAFLFSSRRTFFFGGWGACEGLFVGFFVSLAFCFS